MAVNQQIQHPLVQKILDSFLFHQELNYYVIVQPVAHSDLYGYINHNFWQNRKPIPLNLRKLIVYQLLVGLAYLQSQHVLHRDIKCSNFLVFIEDGLPRVVYADFGYTKMRRHIKLAGGNSVVGSPDHMAPEVFVGNYNESCDIWSLGCTIYHILTGVSLFNVRGDQNRSMKKIMNF